VNLTSNFATALGRRLLAFLSIMFCGALASPAFSQLRVKAAKRLSSFPIFHRSPFSVSTDTRLLMVGLAFCGLGLLFGLLIYMQLQNLPVHRSMKEISELIYETCKTYLITQGKFIMISGCSSRSLSSLTSAFCVRCRASGSADCADDLVFQFGRYRRKLRRRLVWYSGQHLRQFAHRVRQSGRKALPDLSIPLKAGMSIGMLLISVELLIMLFILLFVPGEYAGPCFIGFAMRRIARRCGAVRIAGGIFTKIADIGPDLMKNRFQD